MSAAAMSRVRVAALLAALTMAPSPPPGAMAKGIDPPLAAPNDNRKAAGRWIGDTLELRLEVRVARWHPEGARGGAVTAPVFAEEGRVAQVPGPLIRVPRGRVIRVRLHNAMPDSTLVVHGLYSHPATAEDSVVVRPGERTVVQFAAGAPGTYLYRGRAGVVDYALSEREQLAGAFIVDSTDAPPTDRVLVIGVWGSFSDSTKKFFSNAIMVNGLSWPYTERMQHQVGDTVRWRVVNASIRPHPMHLHGFYYTVDAVSDALRDSTVSPELRRLVVTQSMEPRSSMSITWSPERPGNWLFHCHLSYHVVPEAAQLTPSVHHETGSHDADQHMSGLVVGIHVRPSPGWKDEPRDNPRVMSLYVQEGRRRARNERSMSFVLQRDARPPAPDSIEGSGSSLLVLQQGEPTDITVTNRLKEATGVHWHGIELESWSDGVAGWSGKPGLVAPSIAPGDSFTAHLSLPRAGTFLYHTHLNDLVQLSSGLFGGIVVMPRGERFDPETDHVYITGWDGPNEPAHEMVNGDSLLAPATFRAGVPHRMRFGCIALVGCGSFTLTRDDSVQTWRAMAKDGADLPPARAVVRRADVELWAGETFDAVFTPTPGEYLLVIGDLKKPTMTQRITVR
jgi:manganese oxidase